MTERVEKIEVEKRIVVADDGTEFQTPQDCRQYEQDCAERNAKFIVAKLPHFTCSPQWIDPDFAWEWYFVSSDVELAAVQEVVFNTDASAQEYSPPAYPRWIACSVDGDGYGSIEGTIGQVLDGLDELKKGIVDLAMENGGAFH